MFKLLRPAYTLLSFLLIAPAGAQNQTGTEAPARDEPSQMERAAPLKMPFFKIPRKPIAPEQLKRRKYDEELILHFWADVEGMEGENFLLMGTPRHFLRLSLSLQLDDPRTRNAVEQLKPRLQNHLRNYLAGKTILDLKKTSEKLKLKEVALLYLNDSLTRGCVREIYYNTYQLQ